MKRHIFGSIVFSVAVVSGTGSAILYHKFIIADQESETTIAERNGVREMHFGIMQSRVDDSLYDMAFVDERTVFGVGSFAGLNRSEDGGRTWSKVQLATGGWGVSRVDFVNSKTGWVAGDSVMFKTIDGGATWKKIKSPRYLHNIDIDFVDEAIGYAAGSTGVCSRLTDECTYGTDVYKTTDGGKSWKRVYSDNTSVTVFQLKAINRYTVFVLNNADSVRRTIDGGRTWKLTYQDRNKANQIVAAPDGVLWLVGEKSVLRSADRGETWEPPVGLPSNFWDQNWHAIDFSEEGYGVIASDGSHLGVTLDSGRTWTDLSSPRLNFGLMFHVAIRGENALISASANSNSDTVYWLPLRDSPIYASYRGSQELRLTPVVNEY